jgi:hypothetical protein
VYYACTKEDAASAGFDDQFIYEQIMLPHEERSIPFRQIELENRQSPFTDLKGQPLTLFEKFNLIPKLVESEFCFENFAAASAWLEGFLRVSLDETTASKA